MTIVSVVIATYNGAPWIERCLQSLNESSFVPHVIVVDNASTDNTREIVRTKFPQVEMIPLDSNTGFGFANNVGIRQSIEHHSTFTFLLNQDAFVAESTIQQLTEFLTNHEDFDVVSPLHCSPNFDTIDPNSIGWYLPKYGKSLLSDSLLGHTKSHYQIHGINAAAWFVRTRAFLIAGGFDPIFFMYAEDDDLLNRFAYHGINFAILPSARIVHLRQSATNTPKTFRQRTRNVFVRARSSMIFDIKCAEYSIFHMLLLCLTNGFIRPFSSFLIDRDGAQFIGTILSTFQVLTEIPRIRSHARKCATNGPNYLNETRRS